MTTTAKNSKKPKRRSASQTAVVQRGLSTRTTAKNSCIKIATCRFCKRELLFDTTLRRFVGRRGSVEGRPCQHLVAAEVLEKFLITVWGRAVKDRAKWAWHAGKTRAVASSNQSVAAFLAATIELVLAQWLGSEVGPIVQVIREVLPPEQLAAGEVDCAAHAAVAVVFAQDRKVFIEWFEAKYPRRLRSYAKTG